VDPDPRLVLFPRIFCKRHATPFADALLRCRPFSVFAWPCSCTKTRNWATMPQRNGSSCHLDKSNAGVDTERPGIFRSRTDQDAAQRPIFPPLDRALIRAMACETIAETGLPLSR